MQTSTGEHQGNNSVLKSVGMLGSLTSSTTPSLRNYCRNLHCFLLIYTYRQAAQARLTRDEEKKKK